MRVLSYNIHGWRTIEGKPNYDRLLRLLTSIEADVIGLNEVYHPEPTEAGPALNWLAEQLSMQVVFATKIARQWQIAAADTILQGRALPEFDHG